MPTESRRPNPRTPLLLLTAVPLGLVLIGCSGPPESEAGVPEGAIAEVQPISGHSDALDESDRVIASVEGTDPEFAAVLREIRDQTSRFLDVEVALAEGYMADPMNMCITPEVEGYPRQLGGMGIHYFRPDLLGITGTEPRVSGMGTHEDFRSPGVLVYEPQADGSLALVAIENLIFAEAWHEAGHATAPEFHGNQYYFLANNPTTEVDEAHGFEPHYELHMWLYRENPAGLFSPFNTRASCEHHQEGHH